MPKSLGRHLNFAAGVGNSVANALLDQHGLTLAQWAVLSAIWRNGDLSVKEIAQVTGNAPPAASRIVDRMVSGGLLVRMPDPSDRRAVVVGLTARAKGLRDLHTLYEEVNRILLADLSEAEQDMLFDLLARVEGSGHRWLADQGKAET